MIYAMTPEHTQDGAARRIGLEIECSGLSVQDAAAAVTERAGGTARRDNPYHYTIEGGDADGTIIELDAQLIQNAADAAQKQQDIAPGFIAGGGAASLLGTFVPLEIVTPPLLPAQQALFDTLTEDMRRAGACGTGNAWWAAFGLHINIEAPALDAATLLRYIQAFSLLYEPLKERMGVDPARLVSRYTKKYPGAYVRHILADDYTPDENTLIRDYAAFVGDRDRALDMLPIMAHINREALGDAGDNALIKARPAFHFRMPDCRIDEAGWLPSGEWPSWQAVETLAHDADTLRALCDMYLELDARVFGVTAAQWRAACKEYLPHD